LDPGKAGPHDVAPLTRPSSAVRYLHRVDHEPLQVGDEVFEVERHESHGKYFPVLVVSGQDYREWDLSPKAARALATWLSEEADIADRLTGEQRERSERWREEREQGWSVAIPRLRDDGFSVTKPNPIGRARLEGQLPDGAAFVLDFDSERSCRLEAPDPVTGVAGVWEAEPNLDGSRHARWMLPDQVERCLRELVAEREGRPLTDATD
jgi:hypothetical protein